MCHGDGSTCETIKDQYNETQGMGVLCLSVIFETFECNKNKINKKKLELNYQTSCLSACLQMSVNCFVMKNPKVFFKVT